MAATGTDASFAHGRASGQDEAVEGTPENAGGNGQPISEPFAHYLPTALDADCGSVSRIGDAPDSGSQPSFTAKAAGNESSSGNRGEIAKGPKGWMTGFEPAIPRSTIWCLNR
jgi:hypothetical protein